MAGSASSPAVKRIMREARELREMEHVDFCAEPLEDNLFEWHFTLAGPRGTAFEGGRYHGRIMLPPEYPFRPPSISLLTPNGRFEVGKKICLSVSAHHPESWQPAWGIRTIIMALIAFFPSKAEGALAGLDYTDAERVTLARQSRLWNCPRCGARMADALDDAPAGSNGGLADWQPPPELCFRAATEAEARELPPDAAPASATVAATMASAAPTTTMSTAEPTAAQAESGAEGEAATTATAAPAEGPPIGGDASCIPQQMSSSAATTAAAAMAPPPATTSVLSPPPPAGIDQLTLLAVALAAAIVALLAMKLGLAPPF